MNLRRTIRNVWRKPSSLFIIGAVLLISLIAFLSMWLLNRKENKATPEGQQASDTSNDGVPTKEESVIAGNEIKAPALNQGKENQELLMEEPIDKAKGVSPPTQEPQKPKQEQPTKNEMEVIVKEQLAIALKEQQQPKSPPDDNPRGNAIRKQKNLTEKDSDASDSSEKGSRDKQSKKNNKPKKKEKNKKKKKDSSDASSSSNKKHNYGNKATAPTFVFGIPPTIQTPRYPRPPIYRAPPTYQVEFPDDDNGGIPYYCQNPIYPAQRPQRLLAIA